MPTHVIRGIAFIVAGCASIYSFLLRERLLTQMKAVRTIHEADFPVLDPRLLEREHRSTFPQSEDTGRFHYANTAAIVAYCVAAVATILLNLGLGF